MSRVVLCVILLCLAVLATAPRFACASGALPVEESDDIVGSMKIFHIMGDETLLEVARLFDLGYNEIIAANPALDPWVPALGSPVTLPTRWILPDSARKGVVINLAEMRLYHYLNINGRLFVKTYPIGVGVEGSETPTGTYRIGTMLKNPIWYVPRSIQEERPDFPSVVLPGADNPLGDYAMNLKGTSFFIHGTNEPYGVGRRVSHGCIRLYPEDIEIFFRYTSSGTLVNIVYQPVKVGERDGQVYIEVHPDYLERERDLMQTALVALRRHRLLDRVDMKALERAVSEQRGVPVALSISYEVSADDMVMQQNAPSPEHSARN